MAKEKEIVLAVGETELKFRVTLSDYTTYLNEVKPDDKWSPSVRFCRRTLAEPSQKETLNALIDDGLAIDLAGNLLNEFRPKVEIEVKK